MGDENPIRTLGDYSKPSHEGYRNTIELPVGNNVVPLRSDTIRLVQNGCSFHRLRSEDPNQHLKDFLKLMDSLDLDGENRERTRLRLFQFSLRDQASNWLELQFFYDHVNPVTRRTIDQSAGGKFCDLNAEESWALLEDLALYDNEIWNDPRDFAKPVKAIALPQDVPSTSDRRLIELENQVQCLMEAYLALTQPTQVPHVKSAVVPMTLSIAWKTLKKPLSNTHPRVPMKREVSNIPSSPSKTILVTPTIRHGKVTQTLGLVSNFMASQDARLSKFEADFKQQQSEMTNKIDTVLKAITDRIAGTLPSDTVKNSKLGTHLVSSARSYPIMDPQCSTQIHSSINTITIHPKQQSDPHDRTEENKEEERDNPENHPDSPTPPDPSVSFITEKVLKFNSLFESLGLVPSSPNAELVFTKEEDGDVMVIEIIPKDDNSHKEEPEARVQEVEYFDIFPTRNELAYHKYLMCGPIPSIFIRNPIIMEGCPSNLKIPCNIGHVHVEKAYIDLNSPLNIMTRMMYNWIMRRKLDPRENSNGGISNFARSKGIHVFVGNFTYVVDFMIVEDISSIIDPRLSQVVLGRPFIEISNMTHDLPEGVVRFTNKNDEVAYKIPHKIEQYNSVSNLEKEHTKSVIFDEKKLGSSYEVSLDDSWRTI
ncbi:MAK10-like protein [Tanacetum coccineum]